MSCPCSSNNAKNGIKVSKLSDNAIAFLEKQLVCVGEKRIIKRNFIFQIEYTKKQINNWYCCTLADQNSKYGGFCIKYDDKYGIPKEKDIIETNNIQIVKLPNRDNYLFFCDNVKKIKESGELTGINMEKINTINENNENDLNKDEKEINSDSKFITPVKKNNNNNIEKIEKNRGNKKYTLFIDLLKDINIQNPIFYLKCKSKSSIKDYVTKFDNTKVKRQFFYFLDTEGDLFKVAAYNLININHFNSIIQPGNTYEISNLAIHKNKGEFPDIFPIIFWFSKFRAIVKKVEDKGEFIRIKNVYQNLITKIYDLNSEKLYTRLSIVGIILEDRGISESPKKGNKFRLLLIGDTLLIQIFHNLENIKLG